MKKLLFSVAILAVAASCSKNEVVEALQTNAIGFSTLNDRATKAANDVETAVSYQVYAISGDNTDVWFINDVVSGENVAAKGPYYWPTSGEKVDFYAYAPATSTNITPGTAVAATPTIPLTYVVPTGAQEDFTVATPLKEYTSASASNYADFTFTHMLSKVTVEVKLSDAFANTHFISDGTKDGYTSEDDETYTDAPFTAKLTPVYNTFTVDAAAATPAPSIASGSAVAHSGFTSFYIAPQAFEGCKLQINGITVRNNNTGATFFPSGIGVDLTELTMDGTELGNEDAAFAAGTHYVFTVTIDGTATEDGKDPAVQILFSADTAGWGEAVTGGLTQE